MLQKVLSQSMATTVHLYPRLVATVGMFRDPSLLDVVSNQVWRNVVL
jgi:hypothetical protein